MVTTIQLNEKVKQSLDRLRTGKQTYEEIIVKMMAELEKQKREQRQSLIEGCKVMAKESLKICEEWKHVDAELDWEWNEKNGD